MKKQQLKTIILAVCMLASFFVKAQNMHGLAFGGYSGISSAFVNPALMTGTKVYLDVSFLGADAFLQNNMYYFPPEYKTIWNLFNTRGYLINEGGEFIYDRTYNYFNNKRNKYLTTNEIISGPSAMLQKGKHAFGISTALRSVHTANNFPYQVPIVIYQGTFNDFHYINFNDYNYSFVSMSWGEIGFSYAIDFYEDNNNKLTVGATAKLLLGYEGTYIAINNANYVFTGYNAVNIINLNSEIAYSLPIGYEDLDENSIIDFGSSPIVKGFGQGLDIGLVYTKTESKISPVSSRRLCAQPYQPYKYRIGFSIMDIGGLTFNKKAAVQSFTDVSKYWQEFDTIGFHGVNSFMGMLSEVFYGDSSAAYSGNKFRIGLPTKISLQFDYKIKETFFISAIWTQPIQINLRSLYSVPLISVVPRFEKNYVGISLPVSLYNYRQPVIGLAVRFYSVTVGTEMLNSWFGFGDLTGVDVYFSFKLSLEKGRCNISNKGACYNSDFGRKGKRIKP
ncbi:MAG TPA: DUF5723 family protein [Bacteroidales bacterium]